MLIDTSVIIVACSVITSVAAAGAVVSKQIKGWSTKLTDKVKSDIKKEVENDVVKPAEKQLKDEYTKAITELCTKLDKVIESVDEIKADTKQNRIEDTEFKLATLKGLIVQAHGSFVPVGKIDVHVLSTIEDVYDEYHSLGGNHFVENLMDDIRDLDKE